MVYLRQLMHFGIRTYALARKYGVVIIAAATTAAAAAAAAVVGFPVGGVGVLQRGI